MPCTFAHEPPVRTLPCLVNAYKSSQSISHVTSSMKPSLTPHPELSLSCVSTATETIDLRFSGKYMITYFDIGL